MEPVRYKTAGFISHPLGTNEGGPTGQQNAIQAVRRVVNAGIQTIPAGRHYVNAPFAPNANASLITVQKDANDAAFLYSPIVNRDYGFAFKRLSDGRIVINITGSIYNNKEITTNLRIPSESSRQTGIDLRESLGYDPISGTVHGQVPTMNPELIGMGAESNMFDLFRMSGESWKEEIRKAVRIAAMNSSSSRAKISSKLGISGAVPPQEGSEGKWSAAASGTGLVEDSYSLLHDSTSRGHLTITIPANASAEQIKASILSVVSFGLHRVMLASRGVRGSVRSGLFDGGLNTVSASGIWSALHDEMSPRAFSGARSRTESLSINVDDVTSELASNLTQEQAKTGDTSVSTESRTTVFETNLDAIYPRIRDDIDMLIGMIASKEHGYFLPEIERSLAMQGEKSAVIDSLFPNRPELQAYAWDNSKNSDVSIVPRTERQRGKSVVVGYLVGFNEATGFDSEGRPTFTRRVFPVKTAGEAEAMASRFTIGASKAELISMLKDGVARGKQFEIKGGTIAPAVADVRRTSVWTSNGWDSGGGWQVGDYPRTFASKAEAEAFKQIVTSGDTFSFVDNSSPQLMVGRLGKGLPAGESAGRSEADVAGKLADIEQTLRRKVSFGTGHMAYQFVSKMMQAIAYGKLKQGKDTFPSRMSGLNWYKFLLENKVSKDEMRITGMAHLLAGLGETPISRIDLAQYLFTVYPRTFTVARDSAKQRRIRGHESLKHTTLDMPFIEDSTAIEKVRSMQFVENLQMLESAIDSIRGRDSATADALEKVVNDAFDKMAAYGVKLDVNGTMSEKIAFIRDVTTAFFAETRDSYSQDVLTSAEVPTAALRNGAYAPIVTPQQMMLLVDLISSEINESLYTAARNVTGESLELIKPFGDRVTDVDPIHASGTRVDDLQYPKTGGKSLEGGPNYLYANFVAASGNAHESMATYHGPYRSNTWVAEIWTPRMDTEFKRLEKALEERKGGLTDAAEIKSVDSMLFTLRTVRDVRSNWVSKGGDLGTYGHYNSGALGDAVFQLGHIRTTQGLAVVANGKTLSEGSIDFDDSVHGPRREVEPTLAIEEIQSDNFQYRTHGKASPQLSLPDTIEQAQTFDPAFLRNAEALRREIDTLEGVVSNETQRNAELLSHPSVLIGRNTFVMTQLKRKMLMRMSNINRHFIYTRLLMPEGFGVVSRTGERLVESQSNMSYLIPTNRMMTVPESLVEGVGMKEIPEYDWNFDRPIDELVEYAKGVDSQDKSGLTEFFHSLDSEISQAIMAVMPSSFAGVEMGTLEVYASRVGHKNTGKGMVTPMHLLLAMMNADVELVSKAKDAYRMLNDGNNLSGLQIDLDAAGARIVSELSRVVEAYASTPNGTDGRRKVYLLRMVVENFKEMLGLSHNQNFDASANTIAVNDGVRTSFDLGPESAEGVNTERVSSGGAHRVVYSEGRMVSLPVSRPLLFMHRKFEKPEEGSRVDTEIRLQHKHAGARSALGQAILNVLPVLSDITSAAERTNTLDAKRKQLDKIQKQVPFNIIGANAVIGEAIPFGFEDSYKPISIRGTVFRAMHAGFKQISMTDARHHFVRAHNPNPHVEFVFGRNAFIHSGTIDDVVPRPLLQALMTLPHPVVLSLHGGFFKRLMELSDEEVMHYIGLSTPFDHGGIRGTWAEHIKHAVDLLASGSEPALAGISGEGASIASATFRSILSETDFNGAIPNSEANSLREGIRMGSNLIGPDGKLVKYRAAGRSQFFQKVYGDYTSGEKTANQRAIDTTAASVGHLPFMCVELGRAGGFMNNYGIPLYWSRMMYWGQNPQTYLRTACDAFQRPIVESKDGKTYIIDPKTGKAITDIDNSDPRAVERVREAFLQQSKYLGSVPHISGFLSEFGPTGAYVAEGAMLGVAHQGLPPLDRPLGYSSVFTPKEVGDASMYVGSQVPELKGENMPSYGQSKGWWHPTGRLTIPADGDVENAKNYHRFTASFVFGVEPTDANVQSILRALTSNRTTIMRFAPKFQTPSMREAMRKKIAMGIPVMMVGRYAQGAHSSKVAVEGATKAYSNYTRTSEEAKELMWQMYKQGHTANEILEEMNMRGMNPVPSISTIYKFRSNRSRVLGSGITERGRKLGVESGYEKTWGLTPAEREQRENAMISMLKEGKLSYKSIAEKLGINSMTVRRAARKYGYERAPYSREEKKDE